VTVSADPPIVTFLDSFTLNRVAGQTLVNFINSFQFLAPGSGAQLSGPKVRERRSTRKYDTSGDTMAEAAGEDADIPIAPRRKAYKYADPVMLRNDLDVSCSPLSFRRFHSSLTVRCKRNDHFEGIDDFEGPGSVSVADVGTGKANVSARMERIRRQGQRWLDT
jgi:hypothetical protein